VVYICFGSLCQNKEQYFETGSGVPGKDFSGMVVL